MSLFTSTASLNHFRVYTCLFGFHGEGCKRWEDEKFVDGFMMGRLRGRSVPEVMAWGMSTEDKAKDETKEEIKDGAKDEPKDENVDR